jgi:hypothetical protein
VSTTPPYLVADEQYTDILFFRTFVEETKQALAMQTKFKAMMDTLLNATLIYEAT